MSLNVPTTGGTILATDVSQTVNIEQVPSGGHEIRHYFLAGPVPAVNAVVSASINTLNHFSSPTSASVNTADLSPAGGMGTVQIGQTTIDSCQIYSLNSTNGSTNARCGGSYTLNF